MVDPALMLGTAVVRTACKIWLKDHAIAEDAAVGVVEIIESKVADVREQRRVRRMFENLEERVADNVLSNLSIEFGNIPKNERDAAALAVADTLDRAKLTNRALFKADLDAQRLFLAVQPLGRRFTNTLSQDATSLYDRILRDCCAYVVEVANVLPGFEVGVFSTLLFRQNELMRQVDQRFDRLPMQLGGMGANTFEPAYLRLVAKQLDKVELFGVTVSDRVGTYPLSVAYVSLSIGSSAQPDNAAFSGLRDGMTKPDRMVTTIEDALRATSRAFIRGEAGSGKTTLLQWLAVRCGRGDFAGWLQGWNGCVPFFIRLRRYSGEELPAPEEFLREVGRTIAHTMPLNWVHDLLRDGRAVVLVDGVDELPESQRRRAREWLRQLLLSYPDAYYVVTSRPAAAAESWLDDEGFEAFEIQPMAMADIDAFVSHWHKALADGVTNTAELERVDAARNELAQAIRTQRHLRMLATNPLMTALICALHLDRRMRLPYDRMELYSIALEMLLERRDAEREIDAAVSITRGDKMLILEDLAYWLVRNGWSNASQERVVERLTDKLRNMHRVQASAWDVLKHLLDRSGLLRTPVEGQIDFVHKTFQEFLAARAAVAADDMGVLAQSAHDDQWREVILMAVAQARPQQTDELLWDFLKRRYGSAPQVYRARTLAVACIEHAPELSPELRARLQREAAQLLPPRSMGHATALAGAGDLALELMSGRDHYTQKEAATTIRMAATIGGDHAMTIIAKCARSNGRAVREEVQRAWPKFDPEEFAKQVIATSPFGDTVQIEDPALLPGLRHLPVTTLSCTFAHGHGNVDYLGDVPDLKNFDLLDKKLVDLTAAASHPGLTRIVLRGSTRTVDISPIARCVNLEELQLSWRSITRIEDLREFSRIKELQITDSVRAEEVLANLSPGLRLRRFGLWYASDEGGLEDMLAAEQLADLQFLLLEKAMSLGSVAGIEQWAKTMTGIYLHAPELTDVERLSCLDLLEFANLAGTPLTSLDFLGDKTRLRVLNIGGHDGPLPDLTPLGDLPSLQHLNIWGDHPVDLSPLARATDLKVELRGNTRRPVHGREKLPPSVKVRFRR